MISKINGWCLSIMLTDSPFFRRLSPWGAAASLFAATTVCAAGCAGPIAADPSDSNALHLRRGPDFAGETFGRLPLPGALATSPVAAAGLSQTNSSPGYQQLSPDAPESPRPRRQEIVQFTLDDRNSLLSFNCKLGHAEWVAWTVDASDLGSVPRSKDFRPEPRLPATNCINPQPEDIGSSGFDRGHMVPSGDRTSSRSANDAVFSMANIVAQAPQVNQKGWNDLEILTRDLVRSGSKQAVVYAGTLGSLGTLSGSGINIPAATWKIVVVVPSNNTSPNTNNTETIAVVFPNNLDEAPLPLNQALVSIDEIEKLTQLEFLSNLPDSLQSQLKRKQTTLPQ